MKGPIFFSLLYLFTSAWAGGYQGCLERVWLYEAFVIDYTFNPNEATRTIGVQSKGQNWDSKTNTAKKWIPLVRHSFSIHHHPHIHNGEHSSRQYSPQDAEMTSSYIHVHSRTKCIGWCASSLRDNYWRCVPLITHRTYTYGT
jgi:hypothetical protein